MRIIKNYTIRQIDGQYYLMPFAQNVALHMPSIQLNASGLFICRHLMEECSTEALLSDAYQFYEAQTSAEKAQIRTDFHAFLEKLASYHILQNTTPHFHPQKFLKIGPLFVGISGDLSCLAASMSAFSCEEPVSVDQHWIFAPACHLAPVTGTILVRTEELDILETVDEYILQFKMTTHLKESWLKKDGSAAVFFFSPHAINSDEAKEKCRDEIFHACRFAFSLIAQKNDLFLLHSASVLYQKKALLFSASSGTGKSTQAALWHTCLDTPLLNGDLNLLGMENGIPVIYGIPWCGTSMQYVTDTYPLGTIVFLKQAPNDSVSLLNSSSAQMQLLKRLISPLWTEDMLNKELAFVKQYTSQLSLFSFACTKTDTAVCTLQSAIESIF